jgi:hypothetical protein
MPLESGNGNIAPALETRSSSAHHRNEPLAQPAQGRLQGPPIGRKLVQINKYQKANPPKSPSNIWVGLLQAQAYFQQAPSQQQAKCKDTILRLDGLP